jgi:septal ring factor EnvC (AmiA/AmiB activator)
MRRFPRGSEWRKWDLHVHPPGTKLSDNYEPKNGQPDWDRFCQAVHDSDVDVVGIADYFSLDGFFDFKENYDRLYPDSGKVFFPNLELRLNEAVNSSTEPVDYHIVFPTDLSRDRANEFLQALKTQCTDQNRRQLSCAELTTSQQFAGVTVSRPDIKAAIDSVYGCKATGSDYFVTVAAANNNGLRADTGSQRKMNLADEIDKDTDGFFGNPGTTEHYLNTDRFEDDQRAVPKPVFAGCDAHSFDELGMWLGKGASGNNDKHVTWIKADPTFEGLQQTLVEPAERVRIQATVPDKKEPYKVISRITFKDSDDFPAEVVFNPGLNAIIGSRSSGKSALLAYVAHAVNPDYTVEQQVAVGMDEKDAGPGASVTWDAVKDIDYAVEWSSASATTGQVIYIPQNSLYAISERPDDITAKIRPAVFRSDSNFEADFRKSESDVDGHNDAVRNAVDEWFDLAESIEELNGEIRDLGDRQAIADREAELTEKIKELQKSSALTTEEVELYQQVINDIGKNDARIAGIAQEQRELAPYVKAGAQEGIYEATGSVAVTVEMTPSPSAMPSVLQSTLESLLDEAREPLLESVKSGLTDYRAALDKEQSNLTQANEKLRADNKDLIEKSAANTQIAELVKNLKEQKETLAEIDKKKAQIKTKTKKQREQVDSIAADIKARDELLDALAKGFNAADHRLEDMVFTIEVAYDSEDIDHLSSRFNKHEVSPYITKDKRVDVVGALTDPGKFVGHMGSGKQKLIQGENIVEQTKAVLTSTKDVRFVASLEGDHIGGFRKSSMTPGKQALFALTLILAESGEPWPLLIDQPEDDLDSRSVCDVIIKDLMRRKRERQVIMVSHNANLVIGADSEEVIVANRHGDDRPNKDGKTFAYLTGSLEHSKAKDPNEKLVLESAGIREHACEILDGGAEAFQKRKDKYRI